MRLQRETGSARQRASLHPRARRLVFGLGILAPVALSGGCGRGAHTLADCISESANAGETSGDEQGALESGNADGPDGPDDPFPSDDPPAPLDASCEDEAVNPGELCFVLETKAAGIDPCDITGADFNRDGHPDLAVPNSDPNIVDGRYVANVLFGDGLQTGGPQAYEVGGPLPVRISASDFSGDGNPDFAIGTANTDSVTFMVGDGAGGFAPPMLVALVGPANALAAGDFDGDGRPDLAVGTDGSLAELLFTRPDGPGQVVVQLAAAMQDVAAIDLDGDGQDELAASTNADSVQLFRFDAQSSGQMSEVGELASSSGLDAMVSQDLDADGDADLFAVGSSVRRLEIWSNEAGELSLRYGLDLAFTPRDLAVADFNSDGRVDIAVTDTTYDQIVIFTQNEDGGFDEGYHYPTGRLPVAVVTADFNHDGVPDLASADQLSNRVSVYLSVP